MSTFYIRGQHCTDVKIIGQFLDSAANFFQHTHTHTHVYIYIYIYVCVCVCMCVCIGFPAYYRK